jgi:FeS assembly SUF system protein
MSDPTPATPAPASDPATPGLRQLSGIERNIIQAQVLEAIQTCYDPEIPVNIFELGLVYEVVVSEVGFVTVKMTLTTPHCPAAQSLPPEVEAKVAQVSGVTGAKVVIVWEPTWTPAMMSEAAKLELGML